MSKPGSDAASSLGDFAPQSPNWCLIMNSNGMPLFSRVVGLPLADYSFPTKGLLSVVHSGAASAAFDIKELQSADARIVFRTFAGTPDLIIVLSTASLECSLAELEQRIDRIFDAIVLFVGATQARAFRQVEVAKRLLFKMSDFLALFLRSELGGSSASTSAGTSVTSGRDSLSAQLLSGLPEVVMPTGGNRLSEHVHTLAQACDAKSPPPAALFAGGRMCACNKDWSGLDHRDMFTLSTYLMSLPAAKARDVPVFLAHSALGGMKDSEVGKTAFRLVTIALCGGSSGAGAGAAAGAGAGDSAVVELVMLLGPSPSLTDACTLVSEVALSRGGSDALARELSDLSRGVGGDLVRHVPASLQFDAGILGFYYVWRDRRLVTCFSSFAASAGSGSGSGAVPLSKVAAVAGAGSVSAGGAAADSAAAAAVVASSSSAGASLASRARTLMAFYSTASRQLATQLVLAGAGSSASAGSAAAGTAATETKTLDVCMRLPDCGLFATRRGTSCLYLLLSEAVPYAAFASLAEQLVVQLDKISATYGCF